MKFSAALSLAIAPVALAKAVHNVYPVRRDPKKGAVKTSARGVGLSGVGGVGTFESVAVVGIEPAVVFQEVGLVLGTLNQVEVIWFNQGNNAATTTIIGAGAGATAAPIAGQQGVGTGVGTGSVGVGQGAAGSVGVGAGAASVGVGAGAAGAGAATAVPPAVGATPPGVAAGTAGAPGALQTHLVTVGGPKGLQFEPSSIVAAVNDMVIFTFLSANHTATQSAFATPCEPLAGGMDTSFQPNPNNSVNPPPQVAMMVKDSKPLWFYCRQNGHCGKGMTFSINPTAEKTQIMFQQMAIAQNGTGGGSAITGNGGSAPPAAPGAGTGTGNAGSSSVGGQESLTQTLGQLPGATGSAVAPAGSGVVQGTGTLQADGSCLCSVECGAGSFPAVQAQGLGNFGGMAGALPSNMATVR